MTMDMTKAKNTANDNPFINGTATPTTGGSAQSCVPASQASSGSSATSTSDGLGFFGGSRPTGRPSFASGYPFGSKDKREATASACPSGYVLSGGNSNSGASFNNNGFSASQQRSMLIAHGIMAGLAFAVFFPFGAISIRLLSFPGLIWFHAAFQVFAYLFYIIAFGLGIYLANQMRLVSAVDSAS
jgi:hypothetical protein